MPSLICGVRGEMAGKNLKNTKGVRKLPSGRYEFRTMRHGELLYQTKAYASDKAAKDDYLRWTVAINEGRVRPAGDSVHALMEQWFEHKTAQGLSPTTLQLYRGIIDKHIVPSLGRKAVNRVTTLELDNVYATLSSSGVGKVMVHKVHALLHAALKQGVKWQMLASNPAEHATPPPLPSARTEEKTPTAVEVRTLLAKADAEDADFGMLVRLAATTGARRGELVALRWADVDLDAGVLFVRRALIAVKGETFEKSTKSGKARRVALDASTVAALRQHRIRCAERSLEAGAPLAEDAFVFSPRPGNTEPWHPSSVTHRFGKLAKSAGVPKATFHGLRHFHCTALIAGGEDVVTVGARVGHARPSITHDIYSHALPEKDRDAAYLIGRIMAEAL
jgi:integrase